MTNSHLSLANLRILVTRPKELVQPLLSQLENLGAKPYFFPTLEIVDPIDIQQFHENIKQLDKIDLCVFTSQNAVLKSLSLIHLYWPILPSHLKITAIGKATAEQLQKQQLNVDRYPSQFNSEALLELNEFQQVINKNILIIKGEGGRDILEETLKSRGANVYTAIAYRRQLPHYSALPFSLDEIDIITSTSMESLDNLCQLLAEQKNVLCNKPLLVISQRMAEHAKIIGFLKSLWITTEVSDLAIIECLIQFKGCYQHGRTNCNA